MFNELNHQNEEKTGAYKRKPQKKITPQRLKNIALYYLKRFESSVENLRQVLQKRINAYAKENPDFDKHQAYEWTEQILADFERLHYLDDRRFAEIKIRAYLSAGKPERYIKPKLKQKGISEQIIEEILQEQEYDVFQMALKLAKKKKIGPYRQKEARREFYQKDMGALVRAGFDYDVACDVLKYEIEDEETSF